MEFLSACLRYVRKTEERNSGMPSFILLECGTSQTSSFFFGRLG